jgi:mannose-6-phosphate isomerase-like protein (cupin superfamily)
MANYILAQLDEIIPVKCPCGLSRRAFIKPDNPVTTMHIVDVTEDAQTHYHKKLTELYLILQGSGCIELDGESVSVKPLTAILIKPFCRHRLIGKMRIVNISVPAFDPKDEWLD